MRRSHTLRAARFRTAMATSAAAAALLGYLALLVCSSTAVAERATNSRSVGENVPKASRYGEGLSLHGTADTSQGSKTVKPVFGITGQESSPGRSSARDPHGDIIGEDGSSILSFTSTNVYPAITWSPWKNLAEPYRETVLTASSTVGDPNGEDVFMWTLSEENGAVYEGREVKHTFKRLGRTPVTLTQTVVSTGVQYTVEGYVMVKYVRREIRKLHAADREKFFDAMEILYRVPVAEGYKRYGPEYKGIDFFVQMHLDGAGVKDCDHWHDDAGIMTHHVGYTLQFEQALQLVSPSVTIPYWEYTLEAADDLASYGDSIVFDNNWFGDFSPQNPLHTITEGRWAYLKVMSDAWDYVHNPYGLLSSPWNLDSTPYVTRHNMTNNEVATEMVSCSMYEDCFASSTLGGINSCLNGETHGPVHILTGGQWLNPAEDFIRKVGYFEMVPLVSKYLWRKGYLRLPDTCLVGDRDCAASCPAALYESRGMNAYDVLMDVHALAWSAHTTGGTVHYDEVSDKWQVAGHEHDEAFQNEFWSQMLSSFCNPGIVGTMYTSAAPYDPLFWVVHPTSDRFLGWRRMLGRQGLDGWDFNETWSYKHAMVVGETGYVCNWDNVGDNPSAMPNCVKGTCGGHNEFDILPFTIKLNGEQVKLTNSGWMDLIYPTNEDLPYMYDSFRWDHCTACDDVQDVTNVLPIGLARLPP